MKFSMLLAATVTTLALPASGSGLQYSVDGDTLKKCDAEGVCSVNSAGNRKRWTLDSSITSVGPTAPGDHLTSDGSWSVGDSELVFSPNEVDGESYTFPWSCTCHGPGPGPWADAEEFDVTTYDAPGAAMDVALLNSDEVLYTGWDPGYDFECSIFKMQLSTGEISRFLGQHPAGLACPIADGIGAKALIGYRPSLAHYIKGKSMFLLEGYQGKFREIDLDTLEVTTIAEGFAHSSDAVFDGDYAYVSDGGNYRISRVNLVTKQVLRVFAGGNRGSRVPVDGPPGTASIFSCEGMVKVGDFLYVVNAHSNCIRKVDIATGWISPFVGKCGGTETAGFRDGTGEEARFNAPRYIAVKGDIAFVTQGNDSTMRAIRRVVISTGVVTTLKTGPLPADIWGIDVDDKQIVTTGAGPSVIIIRPQSS